MPPDLDRSIAFLEEFRTREEFLAHVARFDTVPDERFFNESRYQKAREAWVAGYFAGALEQGGHEVRIRLVKDSQRFPDFELRFDGSEYSFEVATSLKPNRRIGREYKLRALEKWLLSPFRPALGAKRGPCWVAVQIRRKAQKHYGTHPHLLVYADFEADALDLERVAHNAGTSMQAFTSVWVLWNGHAGKVHDEGVFPQRHFEWYQCGN